MATRAHSTHTPLLPPSGEGDRLSLQPSHRSPPPLLPQGLGRQPGPVTQAIRAIRSAEPAFGLGADLRSARLLSRAEVEDLIGGLIDLLDGMDGHPDRFNVGEAA